MALVFLFQEFAMSYSSCSTGEHFQQIYLHSFLQQVLLHSIKFHSVKFSFMHVEPTHNNSCLKVLCVVNKDLNNGMTCCEQGCGDSGKEKRPFNKKKHPAQPGSGRGSEGKERRALKALYTICLIHPLIFFFFLHLSVFYLTVSL